MATDVPVFTRRCGDRRSAADAASIGSAAQDHDDDGLALSVLAQASADVEGHLLVVGSEEGRSALAMGAAARAVGRGRVFAVDLFLDHDESPEGDDRSLDWLLRAVAERDLGAWVLPHHGTAATFAQLMPADFRCRLIHLEGAHACRDVATDVFLLEPLLAPGGWFTVSARYSAIPGAREALELLSRQRPELAAWRLVTPTLLVAQKRR
jgi:hypothetical protein